MSKNNNKFTSEMENVQNYIKNVLLNEFPSREISADYLMLAMIDCNTSHAFRILDNKLTTNAQEYIRGKYSNRMQSEAKDFVEQSVGVVFRKDFSDALSLAESECKSIGSKYIGSEHVLLSILNPVNKIQSADYLKELGIDYQQIFDKCREAEEALQKSNKPVKQIAPDTYVNNNYSGKVPPVSIPLKSEVNQQSLIFNGTSEFISKYTINLNDLVSQGKVDELIGRETEVSKIIKVLARRKKNNVVLVGKSGVGKTTIVRGLASRIVNGNVPEFLEHKVIIMLDTIALISGTHLRGMFEERVNGLFKELKNNPNYILFLDDMQTVLKNGSKDKDTDLSEMIGDILSDGDVQVIGSVGFKDYRNCVENNTAISRKLQKIVVEPSNQEESFKVLSGLKEYYENFHHVRYSDEAIKKAILFAERYVSSGCLPDSAIDVIDICGANAALVKNSNDTVKDIKLKLEEIEKKKCNAMNCGNFEFIDSVAVEESELRKALSDTKKSYDNNDSTWHNITPDEISATVSEMTGIPVAKLSLSEKSGLLHIDKLLKADIIGQDEAIDEVCKVIKRNRIGVGDKSKTNGVFLMVGKSGVGKTLLAKKLAENIYGDEKALIRFDMSEYQDKTSVNKLIGASAGYVGYDNGGLLTEAIKNKPYCVLLLDEFEKADDSVYNVFLQLFDEGRLTDNNGQTVNFKNVIVLLTSNIGAKQSTEFGAGMGFVTNESENEKVIIEKAIKKKFNPEFINRIDKIIQFNTLSDESLKKIVKLELNKVVKRVEETGTSLTYNNKVVDFIHSLAIKEKEYGGRPIIRLIQEHISDKLVDALLASDKDQNKCVVTVKNDKILIKLVN